MKNLKKIKNIFREGVKGIWKHRGMGVASIISTFTTLFVIGIILIITITVNSMAYQLQGKVDEVEIFIKKDTSDVDLEKLRDRIEKSEFKKTVEYRTSSDALKIMKKSWGKDADLLEGITSENLLPSSFIVKLEDISEIESFAESVKDDPSIDEIKYYKDLIEKIYRLSNYVKVFGLGLIAVLVIVTLFIISNTIKLTLVSRRNEIEVMKYVGATNNYIRIPFILEGLFFGIIASLMAYFGLYFIYSFAYNKIGVSIMQNMTVITLIAPENFRYIILQIFLSIGIGIGVIGSIFSIRKYLKV